MGKKINIILRLEHKGGGGYTLVCTQQYTTLDHFVRTMQIRMKYPTITPQIRDEDMNIQSQEGQYIRDRWTAGGIHT